MVPRLNLNYTPPQNEIFFNIPEGVKFVVVTKGRRFGATKGAANACMEWCIEGQAILWGDTVNGNIDRYLDRYFKPELIKSKVPFNYSSQKKVLSIGNGFIDFRSADRPENWEGFGYNKIFLNEAGIILKNDYLYTNAVLPMLMDFDGSVLIAAGVPKGKLNRDGRKHKFYELYEKAISGTPGFKALEYSSYDNPFLSPEDVEQLSEEIRTMNPEMQQQEIYGKFVDGAAGVLWDSVIIERCRIRTAPELRRTVIAIDPAASAGVDSDETGITVLGKDEHGKGYLIEDLSGKYSPAEWARVATQAAKNHKADCIVAEKNQGGDMVQAVIRQQDQNIRVKLVTATKGKFVRAEPIYSLYEQGKIFHVGHFPILENQMLIFDPDKGKSPDRVDSLVWGFTELMEPRRRFVLA